LAGGRDGGRAYALLFASDWAPNWTPFGRGDGVEGLSGVLMLEGGVILRNERSLWGLLGGGKGGTGSEMERGGVFSSSENELESED
jgi:hypothetical protein